jgi:hypothetical protein
MGGEWLEMRVPRFGVYTELLNWLRVLGTAELPHIDPGVRQQFPAEMSLLNARNTEEEPLACIRPRNGPVDASPHRLEGGLE